jgi:hypothetical protein|tara:strand:+ start:6733 stop:7263 length:531 start_codon:yes stop_codon:yes gene_type:complete
MLENENDVVEETSEESSPEESQTETEEQSEESSEDTIPRSRLNEVIEERDRFKKQAEEASLSPDAKLDKLIDKKLVEMDQVVALKEKATTDQIKVLRSLQKTPDYKGKKLSDMYDEIFGGLTKSSEAGREKKAISVRSKSGVKTGGLTRESIATMSKEEYAKNRDKIMAAMQKGVL